MRIDIGKLSQEETAELLRESIAALPDDLLLETLGYSLTKDQIEALYETATA